MFIVREIPLFGQTDTLGQNETIRQILTQHHTCPFYFLFSRSTTICQLQTGALSTSSPRYFRVSTLRKGFACSTESPLFTASSAIWPVRGFPVPVGQKWFS